MVRSSLEPGPSRISVDVNLTELELPVELLDCGLKLFKQCFAGMNVKRKLSFGLLRLPSKL